MTVKNLLFKNSRPLKYFIFSLTCVVFAVILTSCEQNPTAPNEPPKPPGYQEDIYWPSLADSPWPMEHHDPQNTGRSQYGGPRIGEIEWSLDSIFIRNSIAVGADSSIYVSTGEGLYAIKPNGQTKWFFEFPEEGGISYSTPLVAADGTIYCSSNGITKNFYAVNANGTLKWQVKDIDLKMNAINIGLDGTLYFIQSGGTLTALSRYGKILWTYTDSRFYGGDNSGLSISPDGKTLYLFTYIVEGWLAAFDIESRTIKWNFGDAISGHPAVDNDGNIYLIANVDSIYQGIAAVYSLDQQGRIRWSQPLYSGHAYFFSTPIIDKMAIFIVVMIVYILLITMGCFDGKKLFVLIAHSDLVLFVRR
ncbi:MAG: PQQ-binding-like beta-propeller repeat protein [Ignavibacteriales bacterium]|nr:PQQ-binding-like beta-propeller repeat protein [Ignavibacteriales bacterium]